MEHNQLDLYFIQHNSPIEINLFNRLLSLLPIRMQAEINAFKHWENKQVSLLGKLLLFYGIKKIGLNYTLDNIQITEKDRPYIADSSVDFNISHSGEFVIVAITQNARVGVDIEKHRALETSLFKKYFNTEEWEEILQTKDQQKAFFDLWTIKESAIKCDGRGVEILSKTHKKYSIENIVTIEENFKISHTLFYNRLSIADNYSCCVCCNALFVPIIHQLNFIELNKIANFSL